ncbi:LysR family transcriptional regulator [Massilia forsythiae]|uniref:LysR family transcriptional regulator n=1 Tax=Massilia forsythiae TaxID=2728020 RepID=A0A7Z2VZP6_9BURK|nr:LysR substrate-binding domain-containing protein [Massilia forsythiae]QJE01852.1 LysR family transcriptional regulator [Massilia forsythiae]
MSDPRPDRSDRFVRAYLKTRHLVLLVELGRHGSIMQAAQAANLTQPAASKLLGELEHALGVPLFERLPRGVEPTWYGKVLIRRAGASLAEMDAAYQEVMELASGLRGRVALGAILTPASTLVPAAVTMLKARHARVNVSIEVDSSAALVRRLRAGELDIAIGRVTDPAAMAAADELQFEPLSDEPHCLIVRPGHPLLGVGPVGLDELARQGWIVPPPGSLVRDCIASLFLSRGVEQPAETVSTSSLPVVTALLARSDMVAPMSVELVRPYLDSGLLAVLPFDLDLRMDMYGFITRRQHRLSPAAEAMLGVLREAARATA